MNVGSKKWAVAAGLMLSLSLSHVSYAGENNMQKAEKLAIDKQGVKVWTFQIPNNPAFNYRASTEIDSNLGNVVALILDTGYLTKWVPYVSVVDVLDRDDTAGTFTIRMEMDFPFPLKDRDVVVKGKISQNPQGIVTIKNELATDKRAPVNPKLVRITRYEGEWVLKPLSANKVSVMTTGYADPGGNVPLSIANMFTEKQPFEMLKNMKEEVKKARYQPAKLPFLKDPFAANK